MAVVLGAALGAGLGLAFAGIEDAIAGGLGGLLGAAGTQQLVSGTLRRGGTRTRRPRCCCARRARPRRARVHPARRLRRGCWLLPALGRPPAPPRAVSSTPACAPLPATETAKKLILVVIDGLTPSVFEAAVESARGPDARVPRRGTARYARAISTFPSLTPVCLASLATGGGPDVHHIPHLVWYHRERAAARRVRLVVRRDARGRARAGRCRTRSSR